MARKRFDLLNFIIHIIMILLSLSTLVPLLLVIVVSFTSETSLLTDGFQLFPKEWSLQAYKLIFENPSVLLQAYLVTMTITLLGTVLGLLVQSSAAYALSRRTYALRKQTMVYFLITMMISGGLIPSYILVTQYLHMKNTLWVLFVPGLASVWNIMIMRSYMLSLQQEIIESAYMDGAGEWMIYFRIVIPLSLPSLATLGLLSAFGLWNSWESGLLYIDNDHQKLVPLQLLLVRIETMANYLASNLGGSSQTLVDTTKFPTYATRFAMAVLASGPMLMIFPFFQQYFVKGLTIGSLKG